MNLLSVSDAGRHDHTVITGNVVVSNPNPAKKTPPQIPQSTLPHAKPDGGFDLLHYTALMHKSRGCEEGELSLAAGSSLLLCRWFLI